MSSAKIRLNFDVTPEVNAKLEELAAKLGGTKAEVLRKAIALIDFAVESRDGGALLASVKNGKVVTQVVGL